MATKTLLTIADYVALEEPAGLRYELSEGELIVTPSASFFHNELRDKFNGLLRTFVASHHLGSVTSETDVKLVPKMAAGLKSLNCCRDSRWR
jgi:Uma2 family endonuclease